MTTKPNILDFFDPHNLEHLAAYAHLSKTGQWDQKFWDKHFKDTDMGFGPGWHIALEAKLASCWLQSKALEEDHYQAQGPTPTVELTQRLYQALYGMLNMVCGVLAEPQLNHEHCGATIRRALEPARKALAEYEQGGAPTFAPCAHGRTVQFCTECLTEALGNFHEAYAGLDSEALLQAISGAQTSGKANLKPLARVVNLSPDDEQRTPGLTSNSEHVTCQGVICPKCGSGNIDQRRDMGHESGIAWHDMVCLACSFMWSDTYALVGYNEEDPDELREEDIKKYGVDGLTLKPRPGQYRARELGFVDPHTPSAYRILVHDDGGLAVLTNDADDGGRVWTNCEKDREAVQDCLNQLL